MSYLVKIQLLRNIKPQSHLPRLRIMSCTFITLVLVLIVEYMASSISPASSSLCWTFLGSMTLSPFEEDYSWGWVSATLKASTITRAADMISLEGWNVNWLWTNLGYKMSITPWPWQADWPNLLLWHQTVYTAKSCQVLFVAISLNSLTGTDIDIRPFFN